MEIKNDGAGDLQNQSRLENDFLNIKNESKMKQSNEQGGAQNPPNDKPTESEVNWMKGTGQSLEDYQNYYAYYSQFSKEESYVYDQPYDYIVDQDESVRSEYKLNPSKVDYSSQLYSPVQTEPLAFTLETAARILGLKNKGLLYEFLCYVGDVDSASTRKLVSQGYYVVKGRLETSATSRYICTGTIRITDVGMTRVRTFIEVYYPEFIRYHVNKLNNFLNTKNDDK